MSKCPHCGREIDLIEITKENIMENQPQLFPYIIGKGELVFTSRQINMLRSYGPSLQCVQTRP